MALTIPDIRTIARTISLIENRVAGYEDLLLNLPATGHSPCIIGITGAPGAGKSTLTDGLIGEIVQRDKTVAVLCVDPSSPFNMGALLGDRIRMSNWYTNPNVYIRSMASRKELGGLSPMMIEVTEFIKTTGVDYVLVETVGVGQNEIEIAGLADVTVVVVVPEGGDEVQTMKSGIMEIADIFVVNKCDRPGADLFVRNLHNMLAPVFQRTNATIPVIKTNAALQTGISELFAAVEAALLQQTVSEKKYWLLAEKAWNLIEAKRMRDVNKGELFSTIREMMESKQPFNLYRFITPWISSYKT